MALVALLMLGWGREPVSVRLSASAPSLRDESDRAAFRAWFTFLADAQYVRLTADVHDCASLVRHAYREALRAHTPTWYRSAGLPLLVSYPDVRSAPKPAEGLWPLFRVSNHPERFAEFADADTIVRLNARVIGRDVSAARAGDLLYYRQSDVPGSSHLMVVVGHSSLAPERRDWVVYHTGPDGASVGEVRKVSLADLARHPAPRWRPLADNPAFVGVARLSMLDEAR